MSDTTDDMEALAGEYDSHMEDLEEQKRGTMETKVIEKVTDEKGKNPPHNPYKCVHFTDGTKNNLFASHDSEMISLAMQNIGFPVEVELEKNGNFTNLVDMVPLPGAQKAVTTQVAPQTPQGGSQSVTEAYTLFLLGTHLSYFYKSAMEDQKLDAKGVNDKAQAAFDGWYLKLHGKPYVVKPKPSQEELDSIINAVDTTLDPFT